MKHDVENREDLEKLVRIFYDKVRKDEEIGPIFNSIITLYRKSRIVPYLRMNKRKCKNLKKRELIH